MAKTPPPVVFLAFANEKANEEGRLRLLGKERQGITRALDEMANKGECEVVVRENVSPDDIYEIFTAERYKDRIAVFHYAGHANSFGILLESHGSHTENIHFKVEGLVGFLAQQQGLRLVFLNACSTKAQANMLIDKGVPNVIATRQSINDAIAADLAEKFYRSLAGKKPIERALAEAGSLVGGKTHDGDLRDISFEGMEEEEPSASGIPWDLYGMGEWWIGADQGMSMGRSLRKYSRQYLENYMPLLKPLSIPGFESPTNEWLNNDVLLQQAPKPLLECMDVLWKGKIANAADSWHAILVALTGLGKTASMLRIWQHTLQNEQSPIPLYVPLNDFNQYPHRAEGDFIVRYISKQYFGNTYGDSALEAEILKFMNTPQEDGEPAVLLLLDAFNEVVLDKDLLVKEIVEYKKRPGVQILMSTRNEASLGWTSDFKQIALQLLSVTQIVQFLRQQTDVLVPANPRLLELLRNPMMLAMYLVLAKAGDQAGMGQIKKNPSTQGELIFNFYEANMARYLKRASGSAQQHALLKWVFRHLLPRLGYQMEVNQINNPSAFSLSRAQFKQTVNQALAELHDEALMEQYVKAFPEASELWDALLDEAMPMPTYAQIRQIIVDDVQALIKVGSAYQFIHPIMRDFLSALHILNDAQKSNLDTTFTFSTWKERALPSYIRRMIGEIESEYKNKPFFQNGTWKQQPHPTRLRTVLDNCRNFLTREIVGYTVVNVLHIWQELRDKVLVGEDLSNLCLQDINLSDTCFSLSGLPPVGFDGSCMETQNWLHDGHNLGVTDIYYFSDGNWILSAGEDFTLKEWDLQSGNCWQTLVGHSDEVVSVAYNSSGNRAYSSSKDGVVIRWILREEEAAHHEQNQQLAFNDLVGGHDYFNVVFGAYTNEAGEKVQIAASCNPKGHGIVWVCDSGEILSTHKKLPKGAVPMLFHSTLPLLFYVRHNSVIAVDALSGEVYGETEEYDASAAKVTALACSFDANYICAGNEQGALGLYSLEKWELLYTCSYEYQSAVTAIAIGIDGAKVLVGFSGDAHLYLWNTNTEALTSMGAHGEQSEIKVIKCSPDGFRAISASSDGEIKEWDFNNMLCLQTIQRGYSLNTLELLLNPEKDIHECIEAGELMPNDISIRIVMEVAYAPQGEKAAWSVETGGIQIWDLATGQCSCIIKEDEEMLMSLAFSPNGQHLVAGGKALTRWNVSNGQGEQLLGKPTTYVSHHPVLPKVMCVSDDGLYIVDANTTAIEWHFEGEDFSCCAYSADGNAALVGTDSGIFIVFDLQEGKEAKHLDFSALEGINAISLSEKHILLCHEANTAQVLEYPSLKKAASFTTEGSVNDGCFQGKNIWLAADEIVVYDWKKEELLHTLNKHMGIVTGLACTPENKRVLSCSSDGTVRVWNAETINTEQVFPSLELRLAGCSMKNLGEGNDLPPGLIEVMKRYGADFDEEKA